MKESVCRETPFVSVLLSSQYTRFASIIINGRKLLKTFYRRSLISTARFTILVFTQTLHYITRYITTSSPFVTCFVITH